MTVRPGHLAQSASGKLMACGLHMRVCQWPERSYSYAADLGLLFGAGGERAAGIEPS